MYKVIDIKNSNRKKQFEWFNKFDNPCYGLNVKMDVTKVVKASKETNTSFFINFLFLLMKGLNEIEEMRMRIIDDKVVIYDVIDPSYTVMTKLNIYENCESKMDNSYKVFYENAKKVIEEAKNLETVRDNFNSDNYNYYYITCLPWISFESMNHPIPTFDKTSQSVPRIAWDKYELVNDKYLMTLNITVTHSLVDGYTLSKAFKNVQRYLDLAEEIIKDGIN